MIPEDEKTVYFARTNFRGEDRIFGIKARDRRQHLYVIGKTGTGKSVLLKNIAIQDIQNGAGIAVVDPHGELVEEILAAIPPQRINDVIYFNPADADFPIGFNVLEVPDPKYKHVVASDLMGIFTKIWANVWSARMEYIMQNCIMALLDTPGTTLLGISRILVDKVYRAKIVSNIKDPVVRQFWTQEYENYTDRLRSEAIVPIQNKVGQFLNTFMVRNIVGQSKSTFSVQEAMNSKKILLVNVSKGRIGEDNSALLGAMLITKIQLAAMERVRIAEKDRQDFYLYVDEFQNFATDSFASVLSEARKYRLNLIVAHQYINQLVTDVSTKVRDAIFGNAGTILCFRVGSADAEFLETEFTPEFVPEDLVNLPNYHIYLKLMVDGSTSRPFSATTLPPIPVDESEDIREKVIKVSRERYSQPREEVEGRIMRWSDSLFDNEAEEQAAAAGTLPVLQEGAEISKNMRKSVNAALANSKLPVAGVALFDAICARCGRTTKVNFQPDGRRPVYCKLCLPIIRSEEMKTVQPQQMASNAAFREPVRQIIRPAVVSQRNIYLEKNVPQPVFIEPTKRSMVPPIGGDRNRPGGQMHIPVMQTFASLTLQRIPSSVLPKISPVSVKTVSIPKPISLKEALTQDGSTFSGKKLKKKEVNLEELREALKETLEDVATANPENEKELPDPGDVPDVPTWDKNNSASQSVSRGTTLQPGQKIKF